MEGVTGNELMCHDEEQTGFTTFLKMFQCLEVTLFMRGNLGSQNDTFLCLIQNGVCPRHSVLPSNATERI